MGEAKGLDFELFHKQVSNEGANGGTHGSTMDLFIILNFLFQFIILTLEDQEGSLPLLDTLVSPSANKNLITSVYRSPHTQTNIYTRPATTSLWQNIVFQHLGT